jgi:hypothetical protein
MCSLARDPDRDRHGRAHPACRDRAACTEGLLKGSQRLTILAESDLVVFGDGIESDTLTLSWGQRLEISIADTQLNLVR